MMSILPRRTTNLAKQIWFQNRRQKTRSKAHPLEDHELPTHLETSPDARPTCSSECGSEEDQNVDKEKERVKGSLNEKDVLSSTRELEEFSKSQDAQAAISNQTTTLSKPTTSSATDSATQTTCHSPQTSITIPTTQDTLHTDLCSSQPFPSPLRQSFSGPGYLANRRSASFMRLKEETSSEEKSLPPAASQPIPTLHRSGSSYLRLSMTEDGHAKVIDRAAQSPNPLRTINVGNRASLRRSHSAAGLNDKLRAAEADLERAAKVPRTSGAMGRSRDSRAWEFWCDSDARNALASKAEMERSGSAASAISLMRANSARAGGALQVNANRRNVPLLTSVAGVEKAGKKARQPLARASTSYGRLQSKVEGKYDTGGKLVCADKEGEEWEQPNTDSDKENWEPEGLINPRRPHVYEPKWRPARKVLGENAHAMSQSSSLGAMMSMASYKGVEIDDEVRSFMGSKDGSERARASTTSSGEDLDCVQSLLSLSQGNWR